MTEIKSRFEQFMALVAAVGANRRKGDYALFERLKNEMRRDFPNLTAEQYTETVRKIADAAGI